jgi:hypothetical protein
MVLMTKLHHLKGLICFKSIADQESRLTICQRLGLRIKDVTVPVKYNVIITASTVGTSKMLSRVSGVWSKHSDGLTRAR